MITKICLRWEIEWDVRQMQTRVWIVDAVSHIVWLTRLVRNIVGINRLFCNRVTPHPGFAGRCCPLYRVHVRRRNRCESDFGSQIFTKKAGPFRMHTRPIPFQRSRGWPPLELVTYIQGWRCKSRQHFRRFRDSMTHAMQRMGIIPVVFRMSLRKDRDIIQVSTGI